MVLSRLIWKWQSRIMIFCAALHCAEPSLWLFILGYRRSRVQTRSGHTAPQPSRLQQQREPAPPRALSVWSMEVVDLTARNPTPCIGEPAGDDGRRSGVSVRRGHRVRLFRASRCSLALLADRVSQTLCAHPTEFSRNRAARWRTRSDVGLCANH